MQDESKFCERLEELLAKEPHFAQKKVRPFELLKLIRDGKLNHTQFPHGHSPLSRELHSFYIYALPQLARALKEYGFIEFVTEDTYKPTRLLSKFFKDFGLSLTHLSGYSIDSMICHPEFGRPTEPKVKSDIFMVMPFAENLHSVYTDHIKKVVNNFDLTIIRADNFFTTNSIMSDIWCAIAHAKVIIADCTGRNPNVFYEIGIAHTLGKPVVLIAQDIDDIPFDLRHIRTIIYEYTPPGMEKFEVALKETLQAVLRDYNSLDDYIQAAEKHDSDVMECLEES